MRARLTIGDFSTITHLSVKTLRRYHEAGLLTPDQVDARNGYRYYSTDQVPTAQIIHRFRELDMPVREIAEVLAVGEVAERNTVIAAHLRRLEDRLAATTDAVAALHRLLSPAPPEIDVVHRHEPSRTVDVTYAALGSHLAENALTVDGPVHENYLVGPRDTDDVGAWRTEIGWPVFRTAS
jgi:DNA-binding transcriptional MerR regulator